MLSIRFDEDHEWWVSGQAFDRLFRSAVERGEIEPELEEWQEIANANGGLALDMLEGAQAAKLVRGLCTAARHDLATVAHADAGSDDESYRVALEAFLGVAPCPR